MAALLPLILSILLGIYLFLKLFGIKGKKLAGLPNGSMGYPFIGETIAFLKSHNSNSIGAFLQQHCSRYGTIFKSHLFGTPTIVSCDLELNIFILQNEEKLFQSSYPKPVHDILGKLSMMLVTGDLHKKLRSIAVSFINASKSRPDFLNYVDNLAIALIDKWKSKSQVFFFREAKEFTFYIMLKNLLNMDPEDPIAANILEDFLTFMKGFVSLPLHIPGTAYAKAVKARRNISSTLKDIIVKKRENTRNGSNVRDFVDELLAEDCLNDEERVSILLDLLLAGYETTSGLLALVVYFLAHAPFALRTLQEEHKVLREKKEGEPLNWDDYKKMEYTSHVINEALRCGNLVKFVHRKALKEVKFKEHLIPAGWQVLPILLAPHLDPDLHEHPFEFNPSRWTDPSTSRKVTPFGGGLRICPGTELGKLEIAFFLHHFVLNLRWKTEVDENPISCPYLDFKKGLVLEIEPIEM